MFQVENVIIGGGVIGLSIARELSKICGQEVLLIEKEKSFGQGVSSRNSGVIHAGIYYPYISLKSKLCIEGRHLLYKYLNKNNLPYNKCGKLIVSTSNEQIPILHNIMKRGQQNNVDGLEYINDCEKIKKLEPNINVLDVILSKESGIVDIHSYLNYLQYEAEDSGTIFSYNTEFKSLKYLEKDSLFYILMNDNTEILTKNFINSCGLNSIDIIKKFDLPSYYKPSYENINNIEPYYMKGNYFKLNISNPFNHLIYPIPEQNGLGIHSVYDINNDVKFGPDAILAKNKNDYIVDLNRIDLFYNSIRKYYPDLKDDMLSPDFAGIRPKFQYKNKEKSDFINQDFIIDTPKNHNLNGLINLIGIESPGLTSSLAIAKYVRKSLNIKKKYKY